MSPSSGAIILDSARMHEINSLQIVQIQRRATAQDDLPVVPTLAELELDLLPEACIRTFSQQHDAEATSAPLAQEAFHPTLRDQELLDDRQCPAGPAQQVNIRRRHTAAYQEDPCAGHAVSGCPAESSMRAHGLLPQQQWLLACCNSSAVLPCNNSSRDTRAAFLSAVALIRRMCAASTDSKLT